MSSDFHLICDSETNSLMKKTVGISGGLDCRGNGLANGATTTLLPGPDQSAECRNVAVHSGDGGTATFGM